MWHEQWEIPVEERERDHVSNAARSSKGKEREREKGKKRVSSGHVHG
jgi:hypothetical protein